MEKILWIVIERFSYSARTTIGKMFFEYVKDFVHSPIIPVKEYFGYTLEDTARPSNVKVYGETCLPGGLECDVSLFENDHFGKTIIFHTEPDKRTIKAGPLTWVGSLAHGGNTIADTLGCVCVAKNFINKDRIQGSLKDELRIFVEQKIKEGYTIKARFVNLTQTDIRSSINLKSFIMTKQQFWKGLAMLLVSIALTALGQTPINVALLFVTAVAALFGYVGKNIIFIIDTTSAWAKIVSGLLVALGTALAEAIGLIAVEGKVIWLVFFKVVGGVLLTYIVTTFLTVPSAKSDKINKIALFKKAVKPTRSDRNR